MKYFLQRLKDLHTASWPEIDSLWAQSLLNWQVKTCPKGQERVSGSYNLIFGEASLCWDPQGSVKGEEYKGVRARIRAIRRLK